MELETIYIHTAANDLLKPVVQSPLDFSRSNIPDVSFGDNVAYKFVFVRAGAVESWSGAAGHAIKIRLLKTDGSGWLTMQDTFTVDGEGFLLEPLTYSTVGLQTAIGTQRYGTYRLQVIVTAPDGQVRTMSLADVKVFRNDIDPSEVTPDPVESYMTRAETLALLAALAAHTHPMSDIVGLVAALEAKVSNTDPRLEDAREPLSHSHPISGVEGLEAALDGKAGAIHGHVLSDVAGLGAALDDKAPLASPALTGNPTVPTQSPGDNSTRAASTAYVDAAVAAGGGGGGGGGSVDTVNGHSGPDVTVTKADVGLGSVDNTADSAKPVSTAQAAADAVVAADASAALTAGLALKAPLASPTFTGTPAAPTPTAGDNSTKIATTAFVTAAVAAGGGGGAVDSVNGHVGVVNLTKSDVGLGSADNTADSAKPVSTAQAAADAAVAAAASAALTAGLAGKAATVHTHAQADVTGLTAALALKADLDSAMVFAGTTLTLTTAHKGVNICFTANAPITVTVPTGLTATFFACALTQYGTGQITVVEDSGLPDFLARAGKKSAGQGSPVSIISTHVTDVLVICGDVTT